MYKLTSSINIIINNIKVIEEIIQKISNVIKWSWKQYINIFGGFYEILNGSVNLKIQSWVKMSHLMSCITLIY
jgi:hypothetical protein